MTHNSRRWKNAPQEATPWQDPTLSPRWCQRSGGNDIVGGRWWMISFLLMDTEIQLKKHHKAFYNDFHMDSCKISANNCRDLKWPEHLGKEWLPATASRLRRMFPIFPLQMEVRTIWPTYWSFCIRHVKCCGTLLILDTTAISISSSPMPNGKAPLYSLPTQVSWGLLSVIVV